ncbi:MAG: metalloprotease TldD [Legionellales bacterium]|nr:metalloprotease TldD [Legionellales bacterium]
MATSIELATNQLLEINGISPSSVEEMLSSMLSKKIDNADLYFQNISSESWILEDGEVKDGSFSINKGVGVRAVAGEKTGFAFSDDIVLPVLEEAVTTAKSIAKNNQNKVVRLGWSKANTREVYQPINPLLLFDDKQKLELLQEAYTLAKQDPCITRVDASLSGSYEIVLIITNEGTWHADIRPLVRLNVSVLAEKNGRREKASAGFGGRYSYSYFRDNNIIDKIVKDALLEANTNLESVAAPAGQMPVVLGSGWPGVLLHEAVGHGLEGDFIRKKTSVFSNMLGQQIAASDVTVVDNGTIPDRRGSLNIDDEGTTTQETVLIENGYLKNFMLDKMNARLLGMCSTGNARRENYAYLPMPRMTNTYMQAGNCAPEEIIKSVKKGIYATNFGGGQVDITSGKFVFSLCQAYLIENGNITSPIKGATLIGNGAEALKKIEMIGNDLALDNGIGICGKDGQNVPVGVGQPTVKLSEMTVGGTK